MDFLSDLRKRIGLPTWEEAKGGLRSGVTAVHDALQGAGDAVSSSFNGALERSTARSQAIIDQQAQDDAARQAELAAQPLVSPESAEGLRARMQGIRSTLGIPVMPAAQPTQRYGVDGTVPYRDPEELRKLNPHMIGVRG